MLCVASLFAAEGEYIYKLYLTLTDERDLKRPSQKRVAQAARPLPSDGESPSLDIQTHIRITIVYVKLSGKDSPLLGRIRFRP